MTVKNDWKPSRWTPPADLEEAFQEGRSTRKLPDGSTAVLSWTPEMKDRWWSYDGALDKLTRFNWALFNWSLGWLPGSSQLPAQWNRSGNGIMLVPDSEIKDQLSITALREPVGQSWSYKPIETNILRMPTDPVTKISWTDDFVSILVSHDGTIALSDQTDTANFITEIIDTDEQRRFYIGRLFKILPKYLCSITMKTSRTMAHEKHRNVNRDQLKSLKKWLLTLPAWVSMIICSRLADAGDLALLALPDDMYVYGTSNQFINFVNNECSRLSALASGQICDKDGRSHSFDQLALEYGPCWLMQSLTALDHAASGSPSSLDLSIDGDHWKISIDRGRVLEACRLAGAMNAPIELWPRFYSILENRDPSRLDETEVLMLLANPIKNWPVLEEAESIASDHGELVREACCLVMTSLSTKAMVIVYRIDNLEDVQRAIVRSLYPDRPIAGQIVDLMMALDDVIDLQDCDCILQSLILGIPSLLKDKPDMTETITGASLIARNLSRMNVNEN